MFKTISPLDNRYYEQTKILGDFFSEFAFSKFRIKVELIWFKFILEELYPAEYKSINSQKWQQFLSISDKFSEKDFSELKKIEAKTKHDVKAIEYFIKQKIQNNDFAKYQELIHFGLTSEDINNVAYALLMKQSCFEVLKPKIKQLLTQLADLAEQWRNCVMLSRTHGQAASPTTMGKEIYNFTYRLSRILQKLQNSRFFCKNKWLHW